LRSSKQDMGRGGQAGCREREARAGPRQVEKKAFLRGFEEAASHNDLAEPAPTPTPIARANISTKH
jgi:hypothetical protein